jgi:hypothetical protein
MQGEATASEPIVGLPRLGADHAMLAHIATMRPQPWRTETGIAAAPKARPSPRDHSMNRAHRSTCWTESAGCSTMRGFLRGDVEYDPMSQVEYDSKPMPVFTKLAAMLRNIPALRLVFAKLARLLRGDKGSGELRLGGFPGQVPGVAGNTADHHGAILEPIGATAIALPESNDRSEREELIRRRWAETGIKMWNPRSEGDAALNIQGRVELLPVKPGETLPGYDKLEFRLIGGSIVCEGVVVDAPKARK